MTIQHLSKSPTFFLFSHHYHCTGLWDDLQQAKCTIDTEYFHQRFPSNTFPPSIQVFTPHSAFRAYLKHNAVWHSLPTMYEPCPPPRHTTSLLSSHLGLPFLLQLYLNLFAYVSSFLRKNYIILFMT